MSLARSATAALLVLPAALTVWLAFDDGGYFAGAPATAALILAVALAVRALATPRAFAGLGLGVAVPGAALALLTAWTLLSASWSDSTGRALVEHGRPLAFGLALVLLGSLPRDEIRLAWLVRLVAAALAGVALAGLITRVLPDVWEAPISLRPGRIAYPMGYWNAVGLTATLAGLLCLHLACDAREALASRLIGAAAVPALSATVLFTFSRGAIGAAAIGVAVYLLVARPRGAIVGLLATVPPAVVAVIVAYRADELTGSAPQSDAAVSEGHDVALALAGCSLAAAALMAVLLLVAARAPGEERRWRLPELSPRRRWAAGLGALACVVVAGLALGAGGALSDQADKFWEGDEVPQDAASLRERLANVGNGGRREQWEVALDAFSDEPLRGHGAGTYQVLWNVDRVRNDSVVDAHSLYVEVLGELGVVGLVLVLVVVLSIAGFLGARLRGPGRTLTGIVLATWTAWAIHAGFDWDWEIASTTLPLFALAGAALARRTPPGGGPVTRPALRLAAAVAALVLVVLPLGVVRSQSHLDAAVEHLREGDNLAAEGEAREAVDALRERAEPWEALGYARLRRGRADEAVAALTEAAQRDDESWEPFYALGLAQAAAGEDPLPALVYAQRLNPRETLIARLVRAFEDTPRRRWGAVVARAPLLLPPDREATRLIVVGTGAEAAR